jgi:hypothetical protein
MKLSGFNKLFFDIVTENREYLIFYISILKVGRCYLSFLQSQWSLPGPSGIYLSLFNITSKIKLLNISENEIAFTEGRILFEDDNIRVKLSIPELGIDLNYENINHSSSQLTDMVVKISGHNILNWRPVYIKSKVNGSIRTNGRNINIVNSHGYADLVRIKNIPLKIPVGRLLWGRLHSENIDLTFSLIINKNNSSDSKLFLTVDNEAMVFSNLNLSVREETAYSRLSIIYPGRYLINARLKDNEISLEIYDQNAAIINEFMNVRDQTGRLLSALARHISGDPKGIKFIARADIVLKNKLIIKEFHGLPMVSEYVCFD